MIIDVRSVFHGTKNTIHKFVEMNFCINHKYYNMIGLTCLKELMLINPVVNMNALFALTGTFLK